MPWVVTLTILVASAFLMDMSFTMITPFLPVYLSSELGAKASEVDMWSGAVFAVTFFVSGLLGPVWGVLADRKSRKLMALRASIGLTISYALCGIVQTPMQLFAARFFQGLCAGLYPALLALLAASIPARKTGLSMGLMQGGMTVGAAVTQVGVGRGVGLHPVGKVEQCQLLSQRKAAGLNKMSHSHSPFSTNFSRSAPVETNWISCPSCFSRNST